MRHFTASLLRRNLHRDRVKRTRVHYPLCFVPRVVTCKHKSRRGDNRSDDAVGHTTPKVIGELGRDANVCRSGQAMGPVRTAPLAKDATLGLAAQTARRGRQ